MSKNPEIARLASGLAAYQDAIRSANEDLIKLSQRFGRMMPRLQKLDSSSILLWLGLYNKIKDAVDFLTRMKELPTEQKGINIFIISSVCGGTGSGGVMDTAYLARHVINRSGVASSFCYINGVLCLPSVFPSVGKLGIESNAYATLQEIDYFTENGEWSMDYGNPRVSTVEFSGVRPFNICYLIDSRNEQGQGLAGLEEIAPMIAEAIYLQIGSQVGRATDSVFDNVRVLANHVEDKEVGKYKPTAYSSFGTASLVFPAEKIINLCANRLGSDLIRNQLLKKGH